MFDTPIALWVSGTPSGMSKSFVLLQEVYVFVKHQFSHRNLILFGLGGPLGRLWGLRPPPGDLFWISLAVSLVLEALWCPLWMHLGPFWVSFEAFWYPMGSFF